MKPSQCTEAAGPIHDFGGRLAAKPAHTGSYIGGPETILVACKNEIAYCSNSISIFTAVGHDIVERESVWQHKVEQKSLCVLGGAFRNGSRAGRLLRLYLITVFRRDFKDERQPGVVALELADRAYKGRGKALNLFEVI